MRRQQTTQSTMSLSTEAAQNADLPSMKEIFLAPVFTKEFLPESLVPLARSLYDELIANILHFSVPHAWDHLPLAEGGRACADTVEMQRARQALLELSMFPKAVLRRHKRGQRETQSYHFTKALLLRRKAGERMSLWNELPTARKKRTNNLRIQACGAKETTNKA